MRVRSIFGVSVAFATCLLFCPKPTSAESTADTAGFNHHFNQNVSPTMAKQVAAQMVPAEAVLEQGIDARKVQRGQQFQAKLAHTVYLKNGVELPKGTDLVGRVSTDKMQADGTSTLALRFTKADLKDGKVVPIQATLIEIAPPEYGDDWGGAGAPPAAWNGTTLRVDEIGALSGVDLHSAIAARNSAVFVSTKKDNMKLSNQSQLSLAIAARASNQMSGGA
jgi:hypothetical protein